MAFSFSSVVVVRDLDIVWLALDHEWVFPFRRFSNRPTEADPPSVVDPNAVLPGAAAPQSFEAVCRRAQLDQPGHGLQSCDGPGGLPFDLLKGSYPFTLNESRGPPIAIVPYGHRRPLYDA